MRAALRLTFVGPVCVNFATAKYQRDDGQREVAGHVVSA